MLGSGMYPDSFCLQEGQGGTDDNRIEVDPEWYVQDPRVSEQRGMAEVDQHIGIVEQLKRQVAGAITGIPADDDPEPLAGEGICHTGCFPLEAGREL